MVSPFKRMFSGLVTLIAGGFLLYLYVDGSHRNRRLEANPHVQARVERTWTSMGKHSSRYADLTFPRPEGGPLCHASQVRLGTAAVAAAVGQRIDVVPIPGSCDAPDAPTAAQSPLALRVEITFSFGMFIFGAMQIAGMPLPLQRRFA